MKKVTALISIISIFYLSTGFLNNKSSTGQYKITSNSVLKLEGETNVNSFTCECEHAFAPRPFTMIKHTRDKIQFQETLLELPVNSLDCGNRVMNKDLQKALNAEEFPYITIRLLEVNQNNCNRVGELNDWVNLNAHIEITLNGIDNKYWLNITARQLGPDNFRMIGQKTLKMSDFCVDPPKALMGMVQVKDRIKINLDLEIELDKVQ